MSAYSKENLIDDLAGLGIGVIETAVSYAYYTAESYSDYIEELEARYGPNRATLKALPSFLKPLGAGALTYAITRKPWLAIAAGLGTAFVESIALDARAFQNETLNESNQNIGDSVFDHS